MKIRIMYLLFTQDREDIMQFQDLITDVLYLSTKSNSLNYCLHLRYQHIQIIDPTFISSSHGKLNVNNLPFSCSILLFSSTPSALCMVWITMPKTLPFTTALHLYCYKPFQHSFPYINGWVLCRTAAAPLIKHGE